MEYKGYEIIAQVTEFFTLDDDNALNQEISEQEIELLVADENYTPISYTRHKTLKQAQDEIDDLEGENI